MSTAVIVQPQQNELAERFLPVFDLATAGTRYKQFQEFVAKELHDNVDYGLIPGTDKKTLLKPGAEKLCTLFGLVARYEIIEQIEDWMGSAYGKPLFYYKVRCQLWRGDNIMGEGFGSCSSWESKYLYRWVSEEVAQRAGLELSELQTRCGKISEFAFAIDRAETSGQYGKPPGYWKKWKDAIKSGAAQPCLKRTKAGVDKDAYEMGSTVYRVFNPDFADCLNTVLKIAKKRAHVDATLGTTNASDYFSQDVEDYIEEVIDTTPEEFVTTAKIDIGPHKPNTQAAANYVRNQKLERLSEENRMRDKLTAEVVEANRKLQQTIRGEAQETEPEESDAPARPTPKASGDTYWDVINDVITNGNRGDKITQIHKLLDELRKHLSADDVQQVLVTALEHQGIENLDQMNRLSQARNIGKEIYLLLKPFMAQREVTA